jgi:hypothetical protein
MRVMVTWTGADHPLITAKGAVRAGGGSLAADDRRA